MSLRTSAPERPLLTWLAVVVVAALVGLPIFAMTLQRWWLSPDAVEHLLIAHQWLNGSGFVVPVQWHYYLDPPPPHPAIWSRAPLISLLAALPLALGASVSGVALLHAALAGGVAGGAVRFATRIMTLPFAIATALLLGFSGTYQLLGRYVWTEITAIGMFLAVVATSSRVANGPRGALVCALLTWISWLTRPNLVALLLAVAVAVVMSLGPRQALRHAGLWCYVLVSGGLVLVTRLGVQAATSLAPYAGYGVVTQILDFTDLFAYRKEFTGTIPFIREHFDQVLAQLQLRASQLFEVLFLNRFYSFPGYLALLGLYSALRPNRGSIEVRVLGLSLLGFGTLVVGMYSSFDSLRHPILVVVAAMLLGGLGLDDLSARLASRQTRAWAARSIRVVPLILVGLLIVPSAAIALRHGLNAMEKFREQGGTSEAWRANDRSIARLCPQFPAEALVASTRPWTIALYCGNAAIRYPNDLGNLPRLERFLDERQPGIIVTEKERINRVLRKSGRTQLIRRERRGFSVWRVTGVPPLQWSPAPPLACAGQPESCRVKLGRPGP